MASLSNINGIFDVHSTGAIQFNGNHGTAGQILKSNGNAAPTWVAASTVIGGPYLPLTGGTLTGATATASGISFTVGGTLTGTSATFSGTVTANQFISTNNGNGTNYRIGDDVWIGDINIANTFRVQGVQDSSQGYITFGSNNTQLGRSGTGALTWGGDASFTGNVSIGVYASANTGSLLLNGSTANRQSVLKCTNGNLHIDADSTYVTYINYYTGSGGITFGNGAGAASGAAVSSTGIIYATGGNSGIWNTHTSNTGTVTSVATGNGLTGGTITSTGTLTMSGDYTGSLSITGANLAGTSFSDPDIVLSITDEDTTASIRNKMTGSSAITKISDATAPAPGCFQVNGSYYPQGFGPYYKISEGDEFTFEFWMRYVSGAATYNLLYAGSNFYNAAGTYLGNSQRYWGESSLNINANTGTGWYHVSGTLGPSRGTATGDIPTTAEKMKLLFLFNYNPNGSIVTNYCGLKVYKSNPTVTKLYRKTLGSEASSSGRNRDLVIDSDGDIFGKDITASGNFTASNFSGSSSGTNTGDQTNITGNAGTSTTFSTGRTNYKGVTDAAVIGQMMWKNYGNNHTIFDASSGTSPQGNVISNTNSINAWTATYPTLMGWNGSSTYGVRVDSARIADSAANQGNYLLLTGGTISGTLTTNGQITANSTLYLKDQITLPASGLSSVSGRPAYAIYQEGGAWTHPYTDLCIAMHTGIKFGANTSYNGMRFYDDYTMATQVMSINNSSDGLGAGNVYINNSLQVGNSLTATTFIGALTGNATSANNVGGLTPNMIVSGGSGGRKSTRVYSFAGTSEPSGFYYGSNIANNPPTTDWINYIQSAGDSWTSGNNYSFQLTHAFHSDNFWVSRTTNGSQSTARLVLDGGGSSQTKSGALTSGTSMTAPVFYDYNNAGYYGNFASTSVLNALQFNYTQHGSANNIRMGNSTTMNAISSGTNNAAFGVEALGGCSTGSRNFAYGYAALYSLSSGGSNIAMGDATGYNVTSGSNNLLFGQNAGRTGYQSPYQSIAGVTSGSNQIHMGNESHSTARIQISWTVNSDSRDKTDVTPIDVGLDFVKDLNPVTFRWDKRSDYKDRTPTGENKLEELTLGFLAQEVEEVEKSYGYDVANKTNLVVDRDVEQDHFGITYEKMIPILTKAIQELEARVKELENK